MTSICILLLPIFILFIKIKIVMMTDFCSINKNHILCNPDPKPVQNCGNEKFSIFPNNDKDREVILHAFNQYRNEISTGRKKLFEEILPAASDMLQLRYSNLCEKASFNYLRFCKIDKTGELAAPKCCNCLNIGEFQVYGLLVKYQTDQERSMFPFEKLIDFILVAKERVSSKFRDVQNNLTTKGLDTDNSWILYSSRISHVGCAFQRFKVSGTHLGFQLLMCCYIGAFPEDVLNKEIYTQGKGASKCPPNTQPSSKYQNLCECKKGAKCYTKAPRLTSSCDADKPDIVPSEMTSVNKQIDHIPLHLDASFPEELAMGPVERLQVSDLRRRKVTLKSVEATTSSNSDDDSSSGCKAFKPNVWAVFAVVFRLLTMLQ